MLIFISKFIYVDYEKMAPSLRKEGAKMYTFINNFAAFAKTI